MTLLKNSMQRFGVICIQTTQKAKLLNLKDGLNYFEVPKISTLNVCDV